MSDVNKVVKAKTEILREVSFFSPFVVRMRGENFRETKTPEQKARIPTMAVDARGRYWWNPDFVDKLTPRELKTVLKHEIIHTALLHIGRLRGRIPELWNIAADIKTNDVLEWDFHQCSFPDGAIQTDASRNCKLPFAMVEDVPNKSVETIYAELYKEANDQGMVKKLALVGSQKGEGEGEGGGGGLDRGENADGHIHNPEDVGDEPVTAEEAERVQAQIREVVASAATQSKMRGNLPAGMERLIDDLLDAKVDWRTVLSRSIRKELLFDYTYRRPHRRSHSVGVYLPSPLKEGAEVTASIDLSGSVSKREMTEFLSELVGMSDQFPNLQMTIITHDYEVQDVHELNRATREEILRCEMKGGGGTSHKDVFRKVEEDYPMCRLLVCFTDGWTDFPTPPPERFQVLWVITANGIDTKDVPYGEAVKL